MDIRKCLKMLRDIRDVAFATIDPEGMPQVRIIDIMLEDGEHAYFCTARGKDFYRQLCSSGSIAVTGMNSDYQMLRLNGKAVKTYDQKTWIDRIFAENPSMESVYPGESRYILEPFRIDAEYIELFDLSKEPIYRETVLDVHNVRKGFSITDKCIGCGLCLKDCPQHCINEGTPYVIEQSHCLHCGLCRENCPVQAVEKRG